MTNKVKRSDKPTSKVDKKSSTKNLFLNVAILLLGIIIIYMTFSIISKIFIKESDNGLEDNKHTASNIVQLEVLNGCGVSGTGQKVTDFLRKNNFDVVNVSNYIVNNQYINDISHTLVIDRIGNKANAKKVADLLGVKNENIIEQINNDYFLDVSLIIGRDFNQLKPYK
ncbi:MAG: LytR C-terminal domain-containing protein [Ignavibacteriales bacterium]|nr:LytR C-terminal domain-containing protein [Ignavibacteriales bacterium]